jgi:polyisoprenoid-binding protein YceI
MKYALVLLIAGISTTLLAQNWEIQEGYEISFSGKKAEGSFRGLEGIIQFDPNDLNTARFEVTLDVETIETGNNTKNKHARSENWFAAKAFPRITFTSNQVTKTVQGYQLNGELSIRGVKKEAAIDFTFTDQGMSGRFTGKMQINRKDFGIEGNFMEFLVGDEFEVELNVPVVKKAL